MKNDHFSAIFWISLIFNLFILIIFFFPEIPIFDALIFAYGLLILLFFVVVLVYTLIYSFIKLKRHGLKSFVPFLMCIFTILIVTGTIVIHTHNTEIVAQECNSTPGGYLINNNNVEYVSGYYWYDNCGPIGCGEPECQKRSETLPNVDLETFEVINDNYAKDKNNVYHEFLPMNDAADPETFEVSSDEYMGINKEECNSTPSEYSINKDAVEYVLYYWHNKCKTYYCGEEHCVKSSYKLSDVDLETFEVVNDEYAKDKNNVYKSNKVLEGIDPETFTL